jgi:hypothetical protein
VSPSPTSPGAGAPPGRRWCVTLPSAEWLGPWLPEREICFRY